MSRTTIFWIVAGISIIAAIVIAVCAPEYSHGAIGVGGTVITVAGFALTFWQLLETKSAAEAAENAAKEATQRIKRSRGAFMLARIIDATSETNGSFKREEWELASNRADNLAQRIYDLVMHYDGDAIWTDLAANMHSWSRRFAVVERGAPKERLVDSEWAWLTDRINEKAAKEYQAANAEEVNNG